MGPALRYGARFRDGGGDLLLAGPVPSPDARPRVQPKFVGDSVGLSTTMTFLSLLVWTLVLGPLGAILAIPLSLLVKCVFLEAEPRNRWAALLVANAGALTEPPATEVSPTRAPPDSGSGSG